MHVGGQLGSLDPDDVQKAFSQALPGLQACHAQGLSRVRWLGGEIKVFLRIGEDGQARYGYFEDTTLGERETETCMMHALMEAAWPKPRGGEGEVKSSFGFDPPPGTPTPETWGSDSVTPQLVEVHPRIAACKGKLDTSMKVTGYIVTGAPPPKKGAPRARPTRKPRGAHAPDLHGHFLTLGVAIPTADADDVVACVTKVLLETSVITPKRVAKVSFSL